MELRIQSPYAGGGSWESATRRKEESAKSHASWSNEKEAEDTVVKTLTTKGAVEAERTATEGRGHNISSAGPSKQRSNLPLGGCWNCLSILPYNHSLDSVHVQALQP